MKDVVQKIYVGLDIAKESIDVCILPKREHFTISNDPQGFRQLMKRLPRQVERIVMEPTARFGRGVLLALQKKDYPVCSINPRQIRRFAQALGFLAKTDKIDAFVNAKFAEAVAVKPAQPVDRQRLKLADLETTRKQFVDDIVRYKNRMQGAEKSMQTMYRSIIRQIKTQLNKINHDIQQLVAQHPSWQAIVEILRSVKGVGQVTSYTLVAKLPELGCISNRAIAALLGVAPFNRDSGYYRGQRRTGGGRKDVRDVMHMAALVAAHHHPEISLFYQRLLGKGKLKKVALTACLRKLIVILNAKVRDYLAQQDEGTRPASFAL